MNFDVYFLWHDGAFLENYHSVRVYMQGGMPWDEGWCVMLDTRQGPKFISIEPGKGYV